MLNQLTADQKTGFPLVRENAIVDNGVEIQAVNGLIGKDYTFILVRLSTWLTPPIFNFSIIFLFFLFFILPVFDQVAIRADVSVNSYFSSLVNFLVLLLDRDTSGSLVRVRDGR